MPVPNSSAGDRPGVVTNGGPTQTGCAPGAGRATHNEATHIEPTTNLANTVKIESRSLRDDRKLLGAAGSEERATGDR